jgi:hypothetical protein
MHWAARWTGSVCSNNGDKNSGTNAGNRSSAAASSGGRDGEAAPRHGLWVVMRARVGGVCEWVGVVVGTVSRWEMLGAGYWVGRPYWVVEGHTFVAGGRA